MINSNVMCFWGVQIIAAARDVEEKQNIYAPYNILPLDAAGASQSIMQLEEVGNIDFQIEAF